MLKLCPQCHETKDIFEFPKGGKKGIYSWCKVCSSKKSKKYQLLHKEERRLYAKRYGQINRKQLSAYQLKYRIKNFNRLKEYDRQRTRNFKLEIIKEYGRKCICCGEIKIEFLTIDHIDGKGAEHRRNLSNGRKMGREFYNWLKKNNFPKDNFQLLCMNCNFAKGHFGVCPHQ